MAERILKRQLTWLIYTCAILFHGKIRYATILWRQKNRNRMIGNILSSDLLWCLFVWIKLVFGGFRFLLLVILSGQTKSTEDATLLCQHFLENGRIKSILYFVRHGTGVKRCISPWCTWGINTHRLSIWTMAQGDQNVFCECQWYQNQNGGCIHNFRVDQFIKTES